MLKLPFSFEKIASVPGKTRKNRAIPFAWAVVLLAGLLLAVTSCAKAPQGSDVNSSTQFGRISGTFAPLTEAPQSEKQVTVGVYINNVYDLSIASNTYYLSGYLWMRWQGDFDPTATLELTNAVEDWGLTETLLAETPQVLPDGSNYQVFRIQGRFFQPFDLQNYPLDKQELALYVEDSAETIDKISYIPDTQSAGYDVRLLIPGWNVKNLNANMYAHDYGTDLGETGVETASKYSALKFSLQLDRVQNLFVWKLLLPLLIVLLTNWLALLLKPHMIEVRTAMPATALLTTVFLQQASLDAIPQVSTLVLMDKIYALSYVFIILTLIQIIWVNTHVEAENPTNVKRMKWVDATSFGAQIIVFSALLAWLILSVL